MIIKNNNRGKVFLIITSDRLENESRKYWISGVLKVKKEIEVANRSNVPLQKL